ncbi:MAG: protein kinase domain-containing protein [Chlamydiia bacterium]
MDSVEYQKDKSLDNLGNEGVASRWADARALDPKNPDLSTDSFNYAQGFTPEELREITDFFQYQHPDVEIKYMETALELKGTKSYFKRKNVLIFQNPIGAGGENTISLCAVRGKGKIKYFTNASLHEHLLTPPKILEENRARDIEWGIAQRPKEERITQKTLLWRYGKIFKAYAVHGDLHHYISKHPQVDKKPILRAMLHNYLEFTEAGYVHRDLKLSNFLVNADGSVSLNDFGLAEEYDGVKKPIDKGTFSAFPFNYKDKAVDLREADIYALGVAFLQLCTPVGLFPPRSQPEECHQILREFRGGNLAGVPIEVQGMVDRMIYEADKVQLEHLKENLAKL